MEKCKEAMKKYKKSCRRRIGRSYRSRKRISRRCRKSRKLGKSRLEGEEGEKELKEEMLEKKKGLC